MLQQKPQSLQEVWLFHMVTKQTNFAACGTRFPLLPDSPQAPPHRLKIFDEARQQVIQDNFSYHLLLNTNLQALEFSASTHLFFIT